MKYYLFDGKTVRGVYSDSVIADNAATYWQRVTGRSHSIVTFSIDTYIYL